ncbi:MAG: 3-deoxy-D-manno-octulosonic acid transferase [Parvularculales bacterium]
MPDAVSLPAILALYRILTFGAAPLLPLVTRWRLHRNHEDPHRIKERFAKSLPPRPDGPLVWLHGASMGESLSVLPLIETLKSKTTPLTVLMTTNTTTSAHLMEQRLPTGSYHQYVPHDHPTIVSRFLDHWQPDLAVWVESELWPNLILQTHARRCPMALINARLSERSFRNWSRVPNSIARLLACFSLCMAQDKITAERLRTLGASYVKTPGNLKWDAPPLEANPDHLTVLKNSINGRPVWIAASTHHGEEETAIKAHLALIRRHPSLLTIIIPRHPHRGNSIARMVNRYGLTVAQRSESQPLKSSCEIYIADTAGEMGLFYRLSPLVFMGGTLTPHGGQNPMEAARLGCCVLHGPHGFNFADAFQLLNNAGGGFEVGGPDALVPALEQRLNHTSQTVTEGEQAQKAVEGLASITKNVAQALMGLLPAC